MDSVRCISCLKEITDSVCPFCGYPSSLQNDLHQLSIGTLLRERYRLGKVLGQGGYGITYLAWDMLMQEKVAVKEFYPSGIAYRRSAVSTEVECIDNKIAPHFHASKERFLRETHALVQFKHIPEIVNILDYFEANNTAYIVMEFVEGIELRKYVQNKGGHLSVQETFALLRPVMEALANVHRSGIIHRDISPDNIMLSTSGHAKLLDFGAVREVGNPDIAKRVTKSTEAILKHGYAPMEQYNSRGNLGPWTDEYAICATIWYCLTGQAPEEAVVRITESIDPDWSSLPGLLPHQQAALQKGMASRAKDRYPDIPSLIHDLFSPVSATCRPHKNRIAITGLAVILTVLILFAAFQTVNKVILPSQRYQAAHAMLENKQYLEAAEAFSSMANYKDSPILVMECRYLHASTLMENGDFSVAAEIFLSLDDYSDSPDKLLECKYNLAKELFDDQFYAEAAEAFALLDDYKDSSVLLLESRYALAEEAFARGNFAEAAELFRNLGDYNDSANRVPECLYCYAEERLAQSDLYAAATTFYSLGNYNHSRERSMSIWSVIASRNTISAGVQHTVAIKTDGTAIAAGSNANGQCDISGWTGLVAVAAGTHHTVGLTAEGFVVASGYNGQGRCNVTDWSDIVSISAGTHHTVGLKADGTVIAVGNNSNGACDVSEWTDIVAISAGNYHTVGLKADGSVVAVGFNSKGQCDVSDWENIVAISAGGYHTVGLKDDGTLVSVGDNHYGQCDLAEWSEISAISTGTDHTIGLKEDGTVLAAGSNANGQCNVSRWQNITSIAAGSNHTVALLTDGTLTATGLNRSGQCNLSVWRNIVLSD